MEIHHAPKGLAYELFLQRLPGADMARGQNHGLGVGKGSIIDHGDGLIEYRQTGKLLPAF
ncbi:MAG: hypothetical protein JWM22_3554 [Frankiales bacterium]|nr:hypothetical protein [Frankiales bacterium]